MQLAAIAAEFSSRRTFQTSFLHACQGWLALTAPNARHSVDAAGDQLEHVCQTAINGRRAVRMLARCAERWRFIPGVSAGCGRDCFACCGLLELWAVGLARVSGGSRVVKLVRFSTIGAVRCARRRAGIGWM